MSGEQPVAAQRLVVGEVRLIPAPEVSAVSVRGGEGTVGDEAQVCDRAGTTPLTVRRLAM